MAPFILSLSRAANVGTSAHTQPTDVIKLL